MSAPIASFTVPYLTSQLVISPDGTRIFVLGDGEVHALDVSSGREVASAPVSDDGMLALTPDGKNLAVGRGTEVVLLDPQSLSVATVLENEDVVGGRIVVSADGDMIAYAVNGTLIVRPLAHPQSAGTQFPTGDQSDPRGIAFAKDKRTVYATRGDGLTLAWDTVGDRQVVRRLALPPRPDPAPLVWARVSPDGRTVAYLVDGQGSFAVQFLDVATATWTKRSAYTPEEAFVADISWDRGGHLLATAWGGQSVRVWDPRTARLVAEHHVPEDHGITTTVGLSGDRARVVVGTDEGWLHTFSSSSGRSEGRPVHVGPEMPVHQEIPVYTIDVDTDGDRALASVGGVLHLVDLTAGTVLESKDDLGFQVESYTRSPIDDTVTVGGFDCISKCSGSVNGVLSDNKRVAKLDPETLETQSGPTKVDAFGHLGFSRDGARMIASDEKVVSLTTAEGGESLGSLRLGDDGIGGAFFATAAFTADESRVLIASDDGELFVWDPAPSAAVRAACQMAGRDLTEEEWRTFLPDREPFPVCPQ